MQATVELDGKTFDVTLQEQDGRWTADVDGHGFPLHVDRRGHSTVVSVGDAIHLVSVPAPDRARIDGQDMPFRLRTLRGVAGAPVDAAGGHGPVKPPMTGTIETLRVKEGDTVTQGDVLFVLEAMKMRNEVKAAADGVVAALHAAEGDSVDTGTAVLELAPAEDD